MGFNEMTPQFNIFIIPDTARAASCMQYTIEQAK